MSLTSACVTFAVLLACQAWQAHALAQGSIPLQVLPRNTTFRWTDVDVFVRSVDSGDPEEPVILFLHGQAFTSETWARLGTLQVAYGVGFKVVAVDLPGYGNTRHLPYLDNNMRAEFVKAVLDWALQGRNLTAVLVAPSMSGKWAVPFLDRYGQMLGGLVMVAPVGVRAWGGPWEFTHKQVRLLAVYGKDDPMRRDGDLLLKLFVTSRLAVVPQAGHACYVDQPDRWHALLRAFLLQVDPHARVIDRYKMSADEEAAAAAAAAGT